MGVIVENVSSKIRCDWMKWREMTGVFFDKTSTIKGKWEVLLDCCVARNDVWIRVLGIK